MQLTKLLRLNQLIWQKADYQWHTLLRKLEVGFGVVSCRKQAKMTGAPRHQRMRIISKPITVPGADGCSGAFVVETSRPVVFQASRFGWPAIKL